VQERSPAPDLRGRTPTPPPAAGGLVPAATVDTWNAGRRGRDASRDRDGRGSDWGRGSGHGRDNDWHDGRGRHDWDHHDHHDDWHSSFYFGFSFGTGYLYRPFYACDPFYSPWYYGYPYGVYSSCWSPYWYGYGCYPHYRHHYVRAAYAYPVWYTSCDPWVDYGVSFGSTFSFGCGSGVSFTYLSAPLVPAAVVYEPVYASADTVYAPPPNVSITYVAPAEASDQPVYAAAPEPQAQGSIAAAGVEQFPAPATAAELDGTTGYQLGQTYMRLGDFQSAVRVLSDQVSRHPGDVESLRLLGVAQLAMGEVQTGATLMERAYRIDPAMATRAIELSGLNPRSLEGILDNATRGAGATSSAAAWLAVAVLMQGQDRPGAARNALDSAKAAGLDALVVQWFDAQLPAGQ
jgi:tetratricopeptide (TPR) repeat protein